MLYSYSGVAHIHTSYSDGSADLKEIARAACRSGAHFILINDHDTLQAKYLEGECYLHGVLVLVGAEVTPQRNHFLCYDITNVPSRLLPPQQYVGEVYRQGGFGFLAHPDQKENPLFPGCMHWENWDLDLPFGVEIWNFFAQWMGGFETLGGLLKSCFFPKARLQPPHPETLLRWDRLGIIRPVPAIAGVEAHGGRQFKWLPTIVSSYLHQFKTLRTHVLTRQPLQGDAAKDRQLILTALKQGRSYLVNHFAGKVRFFSFLIQHRNQYWHMGEEVKYRPGLVIKVTLPEPAQIRIIKDGKLFCQTHAGNVRLPETAPGVYRVEVYKGSWWPRPWIFSNHIYVRAA
ncbi:CehA/McbA family metallohydrolase [Desulfotomaculum varum]